MAIIALSPSLADAQVRHISPDFTTKASALLDSLSAIETGVSGKVLKAADLLIGSPSGPDLENDSVGTALIDLNSFTPFSFVNTALALAKASESPHPGPQALDDAWVSVSRRRGEDNGFSSKLIYVSDWIVDNIYRGNLKDMTEMLGDGSFKTKSLDYVSRHPEHYPALADSVCLEKMKMVEMGYRSHKIPHLKKQTIGKKEITERLKDGDIIVLLSPSEDYDLYDIGIVRMRDGVPYLIHVGPQGVAEDTVPLSRYFKLNNQHFYGYRIVRPQ